MKVLLPKAIAVRLVAELNQAGTKEIGGILAGKHVSEGVFRIVEMSFQRRGGNWLTFVRSLQHALGALRRFFDNHSHDYKRYNYLGEWHSHPSFSTSPSTRDLETMFDMVSDDQVGANFLILMIVRCVNSQSLEASVTVFEKNQRYYSGDVLLEE